MDGNQAGPLQSRLFAATVKIGKVILPGGSVRRNKGLLPGLFFSAAATFLHALPYRARAGPSTANDDVAPLSGPETLFRHFDEEIRKSGRFFSRSFQQGNFSKVRGNFRKLHPLKRRERENKRKVAVSERKVTIFPKKVSYITRYTYNALRLRYVLLRFRESSQRLYFIW